MHIAVTGHRDFITRYIGLVNGLKECGANVSTVASGNLQEIFRIKLVKKIYRYLGKKCWYDSSEFDKSSATFKIRTEQTQAKLQNLSSKPDFVLNIFSTFAPHHNLSIPYVMYLDYTMKLASIHWPEWTSQSDVEIAKWIKLEQESYRRASYLFTMSDLVKKSLVNDYGIEKNKIHVVRSGGNFDSLYKPNKSFGSKQILMNSTDFKRKGIDLAIEAMKHVKAHHPDAKLILLGCDENINDPNITSIKYIQSREKLQELFLSCDLVLSTARCDPFPGFIIEGMNYGLVPIVTGNGAIHEIIENNSNGLVLTDIKPETIAASISTLLSSTNLLAKLSVNAKKTVAESLTWPIVSKKIHEVLTSPSA